MNGLNIDLKSVSKFYLVQADGPEDAKTTISDEKEISNWQEAIRLVEKSEAPVKYLCFNHDGDTYKLYPIVDSDEFRIVKTPILN